MEAQFDSQDYYVTLAPGELQKLKGQELSTLLNEEHPEPTQRPSQVQLLFTFEDLPDPRKTLKLILDDTVTNASDGISVTFLPDNAEGWESIETISVCIAQRAFDLLQKQGSLGTRYGMGNKIHIAVQY